MACATVTCLPAGRVYISHACAFTCAPRGTSMAAIATVAIAAVLSTRCLVVDDKQVAASGDDPQSKPFQKVTHC